jgi:hypothetical protein
MGKNPVVISSERRKNKQKIYAFDICILMKANIDAVADADALM